MDDLLVNVLFKSGLVISGRWKGVKKAVCSGTTFTVEVLPRAGLEL